MGEEVIFRQEGTQSLNLSVRKEMAECLRVEKSVEEGMKACPGASTRNDRRENRRAWRVGGSGSEDSED